ncbi:hypothetical protein M011DRAFT_457106 [Sporormia fimetaria CBS 119925]|uniref:Uncharacterized protein n=1 Tax=Sporormia fimetaria CBS 119925 TaxID=1340428 RepID=A0A6A6VHE1_9PLEO|nr:hypothetical protein M011DRAFT_457106 [Sporormia fimetaria CBS 119925]
MPEKAVLTTALAANTELNGRNAKSASPDGRATPRPPEPVAVRPETSSSFVQVESSHSNDTPPRLSLSDALLETFTIGSLTDESTSEGKCVTNGSPLHRGHAISPASVKYAASNPSSSSSPRALPYSPRSNPKAMRVRPTTSTVAFGDPYVTPIFSDRVGRTPSGSNLYRLSHAVPSLLARYEYIAGLEALWNVTPPVSLVSTPTKDGQGNNAFSTQTLHPRDRALLHVLMYADLPPDLADATASQWLTPFSFTGSALRCWKDTNPPEETTLDLATFTTLLQFPQHEQQVLSANADPISRTDFGNRGNHRSLPISTSTPNLTTPSTTIKLSSHLPSSSTSDVFVHRVPAHDEKSMYAYRFSHSAPMGELYSEICDSRVGDDEEKGVLNQKRDLRDMVREGRRWYNTSSVGLACKVSIGVVLGGTVVGVVIAACFFRWGKRAGGEGGYD